MEDTTVKSIYWRICRKTRLTSKLYKMIVYDHSLLPIYIPIPLTPYLFAIWSDTMKLKDSRITIRDKATNTWLFTIKRGDYEDSKRCSIYFKPLSWIFNRQNTKKKS